MSDPLTDVKDDFLRYVEGFDLNPEEVSWHLQQTTALEGTVDQKSFQEAFKSRKLQIADMLFEVLADGKGDSLSIETAKQAWQNHATKNPFLAANLAMEAKPGPQASFTQRQAMQPIRRTR